VPIKYIMVLIYACFLLVSCSTPISPSAQEDKELAMIEEKLSLKRRLGVKGAGQPPFTPLLLSLNHEYFPRHKLLELVLFHR